jgi:dUTP pyrophosphatase
MKTLSLFVADLNLRNMYEEAVRLHNQLIENNVHSDSGFDLFVPGDYDLQQGVSKIDYEINAAMYDMSGNTYDVSGNFSVPSAFCLYTRSSIYKMPLRMTNCVGIIDSGYRGNLCSVFDVSSNVGLKRGQRLVQVCSPDLVPFKVKLVNTLEELGQTLRGDQGFGSTGM